MIEQIKKEHPGVEVTKDFDPRVRKMKPRSWRFILRWTRVSMGGATGIAQLAPTVSGP
jgi:hypothetical protein